MNTIRVLLREIAHVQVQATVQYAYKVLLLYSQHIS